MTVGSGSLGKGTAVSGRCPEVTDVDEHLDLTGAIGTVILGRDDSSTLALHPDEPGDHLAIVRRAAAAGHASHELLNQAVSAARGSGHSWTAIGVELGLSRQGAQQRFGSREKVTDDPQYRWLGPVTAFDEMHELELAGRMGWHTVQAGLLRHKVVRTDTQWEHKRVVWAGTLRNLEQDGWQLGCKAFPWAYLVRDLHAPAVHPADANATRAEHGTHPVKADYEVY